ncbi:hypothetical protein H4R21_001190 [Coemansia helicoidea]|uniref:Uncharacterized protein n=1 Tax=Coemansia helicoidea TaxID=1286919 RepID=A0ACC1LCD2_9FUNG|nr:hypothetical protein H4R21_001190 [Coemansia helicoidea]
MPSSQPWWLYIIAALFVTLFTVYYTAGSRATHPSMSEPSMRVVPHAWPMGALADDQNWRAHTTVDYAAQCTAAATGPYIVERRMTVVAGI